MYERNADMHSKLKLTQVLTMVFYQHKVLDLEDLKVDV